MALLLLAALAVLIWLSAKGSPASTSTASPQNGASSLIDYVMAAGDNSAIGALNGGATDYTPDSASEFLKAIASGGNQNWANYDQSKDPNAVGIELPLAPARPQKGQ
jgi:hypothetical protein